MRGSDLHIGGLLERRLLYVDGGICMGGEGSAGIGEWCIVDGELGEWWWDRREGNAQVSGETSGVWWEERGVVVGGEGPGREGSGTGGGRRGELEWWQEEREMLVSGVRSGGGWRGEWWWVES